MSAEQLARWLEHQRRVGTDRWVLRATAFGAPVGVSILAHLISARGSPWVIAIVIALAALAAFDPDSHVPTAVIVIVIWQWLVVVDDSLSAWLPVAATGLVLHHVSTALMAVVPESGSIPGPVWRRWAGRTATVVGVTVATWGLVRVLERRPLPGSEPLTAATFVVLAVLAVMTIVQIRRPS
jgi:hypothetical protein